ncbi:MAG: glycosyltransferase, partial [Parcubacteria group bacterium]|nr:glycosyltransferase [Parcubacteria group bacterium]
RMTVNGDNRGFARAHNQGLSECKAPYVLVLNPDVELQEGCLAEMAAKMEENPKIAAITPKLYKILPFGGKSGIIDSLGIKILAWGQVANIGENHPENAKFEPTERLWGVSGACALYRLAALEAVKDEQGIFDERFWMYKEDADLSWRWNRAGFTSILARNAAALHRRSVQKGDRKSRPDTFKQESIKNHLLLLKKNLSWSDWWRLPGIVTYEAVKFVYIALFERQNLIAYGHLRRHS